jgi:hemoglobin/transferrin/lactoferrin receptor protein
MINIKKNRIAFFSILLALSIASYVEAQQQRDSIIAIKDLNEIVVSGNKFSEKKKNIVQKINIISAAAIEKANTQNIGDLLMNTGDVFVQKSQQGGSSPVIRGFEASRILLIVDGVRMNNAIYRSGHLQNAITVDQNMLGSIEILQGPSSTLFGSDALGGAIHMVTKQPLLSDTKGKNRFAANAMSRYSSANAEKTFHADFNIGGKKLGFLTSMTTSDFGDVRMGKKDIRGFPGFGARSFYIQPYNGAMGDVIVKNSNDRIQRFSGYRQLDLMQKVLFKPNQNASHTLNLQRSTSSDVPRYDRLQDVKGGALRFASWYYGPQDRSLLSYNLSLKNQEGFFNEYNATLSYQSIEESRITREYMRYDRMDKRVEKVLVGGFTLDARRKMKFDEIISGIDIQLNDVKSVAVRTNIMSQVETKLDTRYPDGKNMMNYFAAYTQHIHKFKDEKWILNEGARIQFIGLNSTIVDNSFFSLPVTNVVQKNTSVTGNIGIAYMPALTTRISLGYASGFRAPNLDDLAKVFESNTAAKQVVVPNSNLKPENTGTIDVGINQKIGKRIEVLLGTYYTNFTNAIIKAPFKLNGQDSILYDNVRSQVLASQNVNHAYVYGGNLSINTSAGKNWKFSGTINVTKGRFFTNVNKKSTIYQMQQNGTYTLVQANVSSKPLDHIPPVFGKLSAGYDNKKVFMELYFFFNGWKRLEKYNADGEDNAQYATNKGTPAWQTYNVKVGFYVKKRFVFQAGVENIFDLNYRYFASGFSAPGRNAVISLRASL